MKKNAIFLGCGLIILGVLSYFLSQGASLTALIPAFFGVPILVLGWISWSENVHRHMMHIILLITLLGFLGSVMGIPKFIGFLLGEEIQRPGAAIAQTTMALACGWYLLLGIKSFREARKNR